MRSVLPIAVVVCWIALSSLGAAAELGSFLAARESIVGDDLKKHTNVLASDTFEGREAGSRGGRAIGVYIGKELQRLKIRGGAAADSYYQEFGNDFRNILGLIEGSDAERKDEYIIVGAHYDHVGFGNARNSRGPIGKIHNGADDNASGTAGLLEVIEAFAMLAAPPRRSVLFVFWDAEEQGLLGSKHWAAHPTVDLRQVRFALNVDMIGRLRNDSLMVYGARSGRGLRRLLAERNRETGLQLDFQPEMRPDSDHFPLYERRIPVVMLHTGKHDDYHRPSDDVDKLNLAGMQQVARLMFEVAYEAAQRDELPVFRRVPEEEQVPSDLFTAAEPTPPPRPRLGVSWDAGAFANEQVVRLTSVTRGSPADRGGLKPGDRIVKFAGRDAGEVADFTLLVTTAVNPVAVVVEREGEPQPVELTLWLDGEPVRVGIEWRTDDVEPDCVILKRVAAGAPANHAGLRPLDRIYSVNGQSFPSSSDFHKLVHSQKGMLRLLVERAGRLRDVEIQLFGE